MSKNPLNYIRPFLFISLMFSCQSEPIDQMTFPDGLERINTEGTQGVNLETEKKVVFYLDISERGMLLFSNRTLDWGDFAQQYPDVSILVYLSGIDQKGKKTKAAMEEYLQFYNFPYEVFLDPEHQLYKMNNLQNFPSENKFLQAYYVKGSKVLGLSNFGITQMREEEMERFFGGD